MQLRLFNTELEGIEGALGRAVPLSSTAASQPSRRARTWSRLISLSISCRFFYNTQTMMIGNLVLRGINAAVPSAAGGIRLSLWTAHGEPTQAAQAGICERFQKSGLNELSRCAGFTCVS